MQYIAESNTTRKEQYVHGEGWSLIASEDYEYDDEQRLKSKEQAKGKLGRGSQSTTGWMCCGPLEETDEER